MEFGVGLTTEKNFEDVLWEAKRAEELGFSFIGFPDMPYNFMEIYPYIAACAQRTSRIQLGPYVTNPLTRHPSVTASAMATLNVMSEGRAFLALGRGDSAVKQLGWRPAPWKQYRQSIEDMRRWMRGEAVDVPGAPTPLQLKFTEGEVPISLGLFGPRGAKVAGELADCATTECADIGSVKWFNELSQKAAKDAGRERVDFEVSVATFVSDDIRKAREICRWEPEALMNLIWQMMRTYPIEELPASMTKGFEDIAREKDFWHKYNWDTHAMQAEEHKSLVTDEMVDRFCVLGSVKACIDKLREFQKIGVDRFCAYVWGPEKEVVGEQMRLYAEKIIPHLQ